MYKKSLAVLLATLLLQLILAPSAFASSKAEKQARLAEKVKASINKLGVGPESRIEVKLRDQTRLAGYVSEITGESFTLTSRTTGTATTVAYANVTQVKGHNLSTGAKIAIGAGIGAGIALVVLLILLAKLDD